MTIGMAGIAGELLLSPIASAIRALYQIAGSVNEFFDDHISRLKQSANQAIACAGRVLEGAKAGFGLGYATSIAILAVGQILLGNPLAAAGQVVTGLTLTNPVAMTCAAIGAICYGWSALDDGERAAILDRLSSGLLMGVELVRSLVDFVLRTTRDALNSKQLAEFKAFVKEQAAAFGRTLFDVTRKVGDFVKVAADRASDLAGQVAEATSAAAKDAYEAAASGASAAGRATIDTAERAAEAAARAADRTVSATKRALGRDEAKVIAVGSVVVAEWVAPDSTVVSLPDASTTESECPAPAERAPDAPAS